MNVIENKKIIFNKKDPFLAIVRQRVEAYFTENQLSPHATWSIYLKSAIIFFACLFIYLSLLFGWFSQIPRSVLWLLLGISEALFAVNVGHDALHGAFSKFPNINRFFGFLAYDLIGLSSYVWKQTHNREHHTYTNIAGVDPDINKPGVLRLSPHDPHYSFHSLQQWYIWVLYSLLTIDWVFIADYTYIIKNIRRIEKEELVFFFLFKVINFGYMVVIPLLFSPMVWWEVAVGYFIAQLIAGLFVAVIFQLAHLVEGLEFPLPDANGSLATSWASHEMATTANFSTHSQLVGHVTGGLNFQIEHHLLPKICHVHYHKIAPIVRATAFEYNLPYHERSTVSAAIASHFRLLRRFGANL
jgi:linoleoyl-CoA desaturase